MALSASLSTSLTGMKAAQGQLDIVSRNVSNVDTVGYTRKSAQQNNVVRAGYAMGVELGKELRNVDEGLLKSFLASNNTTGTLSAKSEYLSKVESLLGTALGNNSISANISDLQTAFEDFAADVTTASSRYSLLTSAQTITSRLNSLTQEVQKLRGDADIAINGTIADINQYLQEIHQLNDEIVKYEVLGYDGVANLEDKRDQALRNLSGLIDISYFTRENGAIVIQTTDGVPLLDKDPYLLSHNAIAQSSATVTYESGGIAGIYVNGVDVTKQINGGELKGLIDVRDTTLVSLQSQLDELAGTLQDTINKIHNQGTVYPQTQSVLEGESVFVDSSVQTINIASGDVRFIIFDDNGNEVATTNLTGGLGFTSGTIDTMASTLETWLTSASGANLPQAQVYVDGNGKLVIDTGDSNYSISILDEASSTPGSEKQDAVIQFDANGDGIYDSEEEGFSSFFGLNNFFSGTAADSIYDSKVLDRTANLGVTSTIELSFSSKANGIDYASIKVYPGDRLQDVVNRINTDPTLSQTVVASLVPNGNGYMLRIQNTNGDQLEITEVGSSTGFMERIGLEASNTGAAESLSVRNDIVLNPSLIAGGSPTFNTTSGEYELNAAVNDIANALASAFSDTVMFKQTGSLSATQTTLSNYAATFVGLIASETNNANSEYAYQSELTNSIASKEAQISAVDLDEELAYMIMYQQSYAASAKTFTASKEMLDMLLSIV